MFEAMINRNIIYIILIIVCLIVMIIRRSMENGESKDQHSSKQQQFLSDISKAAAKDKTQGQFRMGEFNVPVKTISVESQVSQSVEGFNEQAEIEKIKSNMSKYIIALSAGNKNFDVLRGFCTKSVITSAQFEAMSARLSYSNVNVVKVAFTRCEQQAQEISIFGLAYAEYNGFNGRSSTPFNATFSFKYSYVYRESTDRKSLKCPKCGAPIKEYEAKECEFCGEQLGNMLMERSWAFTEITRTENRIKYTGA